MSILVVTPTYRFEPETRDAILNQTYRGEVDYLWTADNPYPDDDAGKANILHNYQKARQWCLQHNHEAMWIVESDVIPPLDALERMARVTADVVYGVYLYRRGEPFPCNVLRYTKGKAPDQPLSLFPDEYKRAWGKVVRCSGSGLGCVLIHRRVFEAIDFRECDSHCDTAFTADIWSAGFSLKADLGVVCGHKVPNGRVVWPTQDGRNRWTDGNTDRWRGKAGDPTEQIEKQHLPAQFIGFDVVKVRLRCAYGGPSGIQLAGSIIEVPVATAQRMIEGGNAEVV